MFCNDCLKLIQEADEALTNNIQLTVRNEVPMRDLEDSIQTKCYLCTRLRLTLGDNKWENILYHLPHMNLISFDKSAISDVEAGVIRVRLGCRLRPLLPQNVANETQIVGKGTSYGYLQVDLIPRPVKGKDLLPDVPDVAFHSRYASTTGDERVLRLLRHWLRTCESSQLHRRCQSQVLDKHNYPRRLVDLMPPNESEDSWRLVEVDEAFVLEPFATLSHRWGSGTVKLNHETYGDMTRGSSVLSLPGVYREAIQVARYLAIRYLWVDSICIMQDERFDMHTEALRMAEVFGNATVNISAVTAKDDGLFCSRDPTTISNACVRLSASKSSLLREYFLNDHQLCRAELQHEPLTTRGWVLQEQILANRTIYFGSRQVLWECSQCRASETYPNMQARDLYQDHAMPFIRGALETTSIEVKITNDSADVTHKAVATATLAGKTVANYIHRWKTWSGGGQAPTSTLQGIWEQFVAHYSTRILTFPADKLLAIAGVAKLFAHAMQDDFVAGLWRHHLVEGLLWYVRPNTLQNRPVAYRAPTWSWASVEGYVTFADTLQTPWTCARALQAITEPADGDGFGRLQGGRAKLQGFCLSISTDSDMKWTATCGKFATPFLLVRLDTIDDVCDLQGTKGMIIRTTAYRLAEKEDLACTTAKSLKRGPLPHKQGKILLAAQGIILAPTPSLKSQAHTATEVANAQDNHVLDQSVSSTQRLNTTQEYRRVGYFSCEDRKSGKLRPKWLPEGCRLFREPLSVVDRGTRPMESFDYEANQEFMSELEII